MLTRLRLAALPLWLVAAGCIALPARDEVTDAQRWVREFRADTSTPAQQALLDAAGPDATRRGFLQQAAAIESALTGEPLTGGNKVTLLIDGPRTHEAQLAAIRGARHHVHLDIYILTDEKLGQRYAEALSERARAGIKVRFLYDGHGSQDAQPPYLDAMRKAGVQLHEFNSISPLKDLRVWRINHRNHRKLLIVDGRIGFTGGINIADEYVRSSSAVGTSSPGGKAGSKRGWRDTHVRVEGPAVAAFQKVFLEVWEKLAGPVEKSGKYYPKPAPKGHELVRLVANDGADLVDLAARPAIDAVKGEEPGAKKPNQIYLSYLAAVMQARSRIWISQSYFAPNDTLYEELIAAARRKVDVRLLVPGESDIQLVLRASQSYYQRLLDAGVRIYEFQPSILHAKTAVIDGVWTTVGSANLDYRSFVHNDEANAIILGHEFAVQMEQMFQDDLEHSSEITPAEWPKRSLWHKMQEQFARLGVYWL